MLLSVLHWQLARDELKAIPVPVPVETHPVVAYPTRAAVDGFGTPDSRFPVPLNEPKFWLYLPDTVLTEVSDVTTI